MARQQYRKMKAALVIRDYYRRYKVRKYISQLQNLYRPVKQMRDYGKSLPWPQAPTSLRKNPGIMQIRKIYEKWRAFMILKRFPREEWPQMQLKIIAAEALKRRRPEWGVKLKWEGDYLERKDENNDYGMFSSNARSLTLRDPANCRKILFSYFIRKINKFNKSSDRAIVITNFYIYKFDIKSFKPLKKPIPISDVIGLTVSPGSDQLIVIHLKGGNDFVFSLINLKQQPTQVNKIGELIAVLLHQYSL